MRPIFMLLSMLAIFVAPSNAASTINHAAAVGTASNSKRFMRTVEAAGEPDGSSNDDYDDNEEEKEEERGIGNFAVAMKLKAKYHAKMKLTKAEQTKLGEIWRKELSIERANWQNREINKLLNNNGHPESVRKNYSPQFYMNFMEAYNKKYQG